jgi:diadenosine tetraphosphate (Ap4A) HIT family hydrolase
VDRVEREHERIVLTRNGRAAAVLISPEDLAQLEETIDVEPNRGGLCPSAWHDDAMESIDLLPWRDGWAEERRGRGCVLCGVIGVEENDWGLRVFAGMYLDAYLCKWGSIRGYTVTVWNGPHLAEPTQLTAAQALGYWQELLRVGAAVEDNFENVKMNYQTLGNAVPHLHTHVIPRAPLDPAPNGPLPWTYLDRGRQDPDVFAADAADLKSALGRQLRVADLSDTGHHRP